MKKLKFYICPQCGNLLTATAEAAVSCCGKKLTAMQPVKAAEGEKLQVELIENDYFVTSSHEMTKEHYLTFAALLTGDTLFCVSSTRSGICRRRHPAASVTAC